MKKAKKRTRREIKHKIKPHVEHQTLPYVQKTNENSAEKKPAVLPFIMGCALFVLGAGIILSSFRGLTGNVIANSSTSFALKSALGLLAVLGGIWWCLEEIKNF